jgi:hypothetical protein
MWQAPTGPIARLVIEGVHGEEARGCFREKRSEILHHAKRIEHRLSQHEQPPGASVKSPSMS